MIVALLTAFSLLIAAMTLLPLAPIAHGFVRVCDFPRLQILSIGLLLVVLTLAFLPMTPAGLPLLVIQLAVVVAQGVICLRFTPIWHVQSLPFSGGKDERSQTFRIVAANVKMSNSNHSKFISLLRQQDVDLLLLMEVDDRWIAALAPLQGHFPFRVEQPQDNTYGMALFSRLPLEDPEVRFLLMPGVPSIRTGVVLPDGRRFRLYVLHPEPPVPFEDTLGRDGELILTAREVSNDSLPAIVAGDLNDVAWSRTTRRFQRLSGLLDPRVGRGLFNTFDARYPLLRWPLDHLFHDPIFRIVRLARLPHIGSDHFPMLFELAMARAEAEGASPGVPDAEDLEQARDIAEDAPDLNRPPIGSGWED